MFAEGNAEFDSCREVVQSLMDEYHAAEGPDYLTWGGGATATQYDDDDRSGQRYDGTRGGGGAQEATY